MVEAKGRTREEAVARAIEKLGIRDKDAEVVVLEEKRARFLGLFGGPLVHVEVRARDGGAGGESGEDAQHVREIVIGLLGAMGIEGSARVENGDGAPRVVVETNGADGLLIGRHGQTLEALQHLSNRILTHCRDNRPTVPVDIGGYRSRQPDFGRRPAGGERMESGRRRPRRARAGAR